MRDVEVQGLFIPRIGLGTWQLTGREATNAVADALAAGYRHVDTARAYHNEEAVGAGLRASGVDRSDVFLSTKVWTAYYRHDDLVAIAEDSIGRLRSDYVDLLLLHWPNPDVRLEEPLGAMLALRDRGLVRHLGVSNFPRALFAEARAIAPVLANQVELHPYLAQPALAADARDHDILLSAHTPLAHGVVTADPVLTDIGRAHGRSAAQVALRWLIDRPGVCALPKASSRVHRLANLDVFDFVLTDEDRARIDALDRGLRTVDPEWAPVWDEGLAPARG